MKFNVSVVGATGNVGREILKTLSASSIDIATIKALASRDSAGKSVSFGDDVIGVQDLSKHSFDEDDIVFFATESNISSKFVDLAREKAKVVIDLSSHYRMHDNVPLVVPEVNLHSLGNSNVVANPNCVAIPVVMALKKLHDYGKIYRIVLSSYQSVSGAGKRAMDELYSQTREKIFSAFTEFDTNKSIAFNIIPKIDEFAPSGDTYEEIKVKNEIRKMLEADIDVSATCVRIPVFVGHSVSVNVEFEKDIAPDQAYEILGQMDGVLTSKKTGDDYFTPLDSVGKKEVFVSRIRQDVEKNILNMWIVSDNLRKGAALNAVQIAEQCIRRHF